MKKSLLGMIYVIAGLVTGYVFVLSWIVGLIAGKFGGGRHEGIPGRVKSIVIPIGKWRLHLHHWLCSLGLMGITSASGFYLFGPHITYGFLSGLAFQGIYYYDDWHRVLVRRH